MVSGKFWRGKISGLLKVRLFIYGNEMSFGDWSIWIEVRTEKKFFLLFKNPKLFIMHTAFVFKVLDTVYTIYMVIRVL